MVPEQGTENQIFGVVGTHRDGFMVIDGCDQLQIYGGQIYGC